MAWSATGANLKGPTGSTGAAGSAATVAVGTVTTLAAGASATVANAGTSAAAVLNFGIPQGTTGTTGTTGSTGPTGARGSLWFFGSGAPGTVAGAVIGDVYLDTSAGAVYLLS